MKKYIILLIVICASTANAQTLDHLMSGYDNKFALEHSQLILNSKFSDVFQENQIIPNHESIRIIGSDSAWLQQITAIVKPNPSSLFPYLDSNTHNLSAYILLSHIFELKFIPDVSTEEAILFFLKRDVNSSDLIDSFITINQTPVGMDEATYMLNTIWKDIAPQANARIKALLP